MGVCDRVSNVLLMVDVVGDGRYGVVGKSISWKSERSGGGTVG